MIENISFEKDAAYLYAAMNYNFFIKKRVTNLESHLFISM